MYHRTARLINGSLFFLAMMLSVGQSLAAQFDGVEKPLRLVMISIDGLRPEFYRDAAFIAPNLKAAAASGISSDGLIPIFPSLTYPVHASLVTGMSSSQHGVISNTIFDLQLGASPQWYWNATMLKQPALWDLAKQAHKTVAIIRWPVSVGADIDWMIPEIFNSPGFDFKKDWALIQKHALQTLMKEIVEASGTQGIASLKDLDDFTTRAAELILGKYKPDLTLIHLVGLDYAQHVSGRDSAQTKSALEHTDESLGRILSQIDRSEAVVLVLGDHGFRNYLKTFHPNAIFSRLGWIKSSGGKILNWQVMAHPEGGFAAIYVADKRIAPEVLDVLKQYAKGRFRILDREELDRLRALPHAFCAIEALDGYSIGSNMTGDFESTTKEPKGTHGQRPLSSDMYSGFMAFGRGIPEGRKMGTISVLDIAPTVASIMHLKINNAEGRVLNLSDRP